MENGGAKLLELESNRDFSSKFDAIFDKKIES